MKVCSILAFVISTTVLSIPVDLFYEESEDMHRLGESNTNAPPVVE